MVTDTKKDTIMNSQLNIATSAKNLTEVQKRYAVQYMSRIASKDVKLYGLGFMTGEVVIGQLVSYEYWKGEGITVRVMGRDMEFGNFIDDGRVLITNDNPHWFIK